jgi:hypothetical protein
MTISALIENNIRQDEGSNLSLLKIESEKLKYEKDKNITKPQ